MRLLMLTLVLTTDLSPLRSLVIALWRVLLQVTPRRLRGLELWLHRIMLPLVNSVLMLCGWPGVTGEKQ